MVSGGRGQPGLEHVGVDAALGQLRRDRRGGGHAPAGDQRVLARVDRERQQVTLVADQRGGAVGDLLHGRQVLRRADVRGQVGRVDVRVVDDAEVLLEGEDPAYGRVDPLLGELARLDGAEDRVVGDLELGRHQQHVDARLERQHRNPVVAVGLAGAGHVEGVGDDDAVVAHLLAQDAGHDRLGQGGRVAGRVERRDGDVRGHDRGYARRRSRPGTAAGPAAATPGGCGRCSADRCGCPGRCRRGRGSAWPRRPGRRRCSRAPGRP